MNDERDDPLTPAEERLVRLLALLQVQAAGAHASLQQSVMHRLRWQLVAQQIGRAIAHLGAAVLDGVALVFGPSARGKEKR